MMRPKQAESEERSLASVMVTTKYDFLTIGIGISISSHDNAITSHRSICYRIEVFGKIGRNAIAARKEKNIIALEKRLRAS